MSIEALVNVPHGWIPTAAYATAGLFALALLLFAVFKTDGRSIPMVSALAALLVTFASLYIVGSVEERRFIQDNRDSIAEWLDASYRLEASRDDQGTIARVIAGQAHKETFTFGSDEGPVVAKLVEGPDGTFGLVAVSEPIKPLH